MTDLIPAEGAHSLWEKRAMNAATVRRAFWVAHEALIDFVRTSLQLWL